MLSYFPDVKFYKSFTQILDINKNVPPIPLVAITGRSNSGKSSMINALSRQKRLAMVSQTPGKTKSINYYLVPSYKNYYQEFYLCDLPGYGYAKIEKKEMEFLQFMIDQFLAKSKYLKLLLLIVDSRRIPEREEESIINYCLDNKKNLLIILNKWDKIKQKDKNHILDLWQKVFPNHENIIPISTLKKDNLEILIQKITETLKI